jgi:hypothetical protein
MTFADRLEESFTDSKYDEREYDATARLLQDNADAILELVRAAERAQQWMEVIQVEIDGEWGSGRTLKELETQGELSNELIALRDALYWLNGEQT